MIMDPDFYTEDDTFQDGFEESVDNEWADNFFESPDDLFAQQDVDDTLFPDQLNADQLGAALAFGEIVSDDRDAYDIDENTDRENWEGVMELYPLQGAYHSTDTRSLSKFEQYINDITSGHLKGPWQRD